MFSIPKALFSGCSWFLLLVSITYVCVCVCVCMCMYFLVGINHLKSVISNWSLLLFFNFSLLLELSLVPLGSISAICNYVQWSWVFPGISMVKNLPANARDVDTVAGLGRSPGEGNGNPLQYSCLGNPMDRRGWWVIVHGVAKELVVTQWLNDNNDNVLTNLNMVIIS